MCAARLIPVDDAIAVALDAVPCALVLGNFDGVHRGHQAVLRQAVGYARNVGGWAACALTFDPHPAEVVGTGAPPLLTSLEDRVALMDALGVDRVYVRRFDTAFAAFTPARFARELVATALKAKLVVVGDNFRFGAKRAGDLALLRTLGAELGFEVLVPAVVSDERGRYSSTRARDALLAGDLDEAQRVLGRSHSVTGFVAHGDARGRTLGFPTANLEGVAEMLPADGVYAVNVSRLDPPSTSVHKAVTSIGVRPTVGGGKRTVETHVLGFTGDLYGARLRLTFLKRLRAEMKFSSLDALKAQITQDVRNAQSFFESLSLPEAQVEQK